MKEVIDNLLKWAQGEKVAPEEVQIYPTNKCNLRCVFCYQQLQEYNLSDEVSHKRWLEIAKELCELGVKKILISGGGEPLAVPDTTIGIMKIFKSNNIHGRMIQNGTLWTDKTIQETINMSWDDLTFSLDGPDAKTQDELRGVKGCFDKIISNIKRFNHYKEKLGSEKPRIQITMVLCKTNYQKVTEMMELAHQLNVNHVNIEPVCVNNPEVEKIKLGEKERIEFLDKSLPKAKEFAEKYNIYTNIDRIYGAKYIEKTGDLKEVILEKSKGAKESSKEKNKDKDIGHTKTKLKLPLMELPCFEPWLWPKIEANGEVWPCSTVPLKTNIKKISFKEVWFGPELTEFRANIVKKKLHDACSNCVLTHLDINSEIKRELTKRLGSKQN